MRYSGEALIGLVAIILTFAFRRFFYKRGASYQDAVAYMAALLVSSVFGGLFLGAAARFAWERVLGHPFASDPTGYFVIGYVSSLMIGMLWLGSKGKL
jgi:hypothetical protein